MFTSTRATLAAPDYLLATVGPDVDRGPNLMALYLTLSIIAFLFTVGRLGIRIGGRNVGADDIVAIIAATFFAGIAACVSVGAIRRTYRHIEYLTLNQVILSIKLNFIEQVLLSTTLSLGRIAIALMILRIIGISARKWHRYFLWAMIATTAVTRIIVIIILLLQCRNPAAIWDVTLRPTTTCLSQSAVSSEAVVVGIWHTATEFILALYPTILLWHVKISKGKKIALCILLGMGCLTGIFGAVKTSQITTLNTALDVTFDQYYLQIYAGLEMFCLLVFGSAPIYKVLYDRLVKHRSQSKPSNSSTSFIKISTIITQYPTKPNFTDKSGYTLRTEKVPQAQLCGFKTEIL